MGPEAQMLKEEMNLNRKLVEQLEKSDVAFNENIAKVRQTYTIIFKTSTVTMFS